MRNDTALLAASHVDCPMKSPDRKRVIRDTCAPHQERIALLRIVAAEQDEVIVLPASVVTLLLGMLSNDGERAWYCLDAIAFRTDYQT